jgi:hypothetical protein
MHSIILGKQKILYPSKWEEVSGDQLVQLADIMHSEISTAEALTRILIVLMNMRKQSLKIRFQWAFIVTYEFKYDCVKSAEWVLQNDFDCTDQKLPVIKNKGKKGFSLFGPLMECRGLVFIEFIEADMAYLDVRKHYDDKVKRLEALDLLTVILYRDRNKEMPKSGGRNGLNDWNGDPRVPYNTNILDYRIKEVKDMPIGYKYAIFLFYHACHMHLEKQNPNIFKKADAESEGNEGGNWASALKSLAGGSINVDKMMAVNASFALSDLDDRIAEAEEMAAK